MRITCMGTLRANDSEWTASASPLICPVLLHSSSDEQLTFSRKWFESLSGHNRKQLSEESHELEEQHFAVVD